MVLVNVYPLPQVSAGTSTTIPLFTSIMIGGSPTSPTGISFSWTPAFTLDNPVIPNPTASNTVNTTYTVYVTDANGCTASDTIQVEIYPEIKIPNGFSPNGDGKNDFWVIDNIDQFPDCTIEVYNRWGERLYFAPKGYSPLFNGKYKGSDLPVGTYYYIINLNHPAYPKAYTGPLTIFR
jgi:gliding motility-associated-like protein